MTKRRAREAYLCHEYPKYTETFVYREIDRLRTMGSDILVLAMKPPELPGAIEGAAQKIRMAQYLPRDFGVTFLIAQAEAILHSPVRYTNLFVAMLRADSIASAATIRVRLGLFLRGTLAAHQLRRLGDVRLIHCPATGDELIAAHTASVLSGIPLSFTLHAPLALFRSSPLLARQAHDAILVTAESEHVRDRLIDLSGSEVVEKTRIIHCGVDLPESFTPAGKTENLVISVGSLSRYKGHDILIRAIGMLIQKGIDATCHIYGEGPERPRLEALIAELGIDDKVMLKGGKSPEILRECLDGARCFALASRVDEKGARDGVPVAIMDAMAKARPCVSTLISGIPELVAEKETGFLVEPENPEALADAIGRLLENPDLATRMGEAGRRRVAKTFSLEEGVRRLKTEFDSCSHSIAYISHEYPKITETFVRREVEALRKAGARIKLFSFRKPQKGADGKTIYLPSANSPRLYLGSLKKMIMRPGTSLKMLRKAVWSVGKPGTWRAGWGGVVDVFRGAWIAGKLGPEIAGIHGSFAGVAATAAWAAGKLAGLPFGFSSHSSPPDPLLEDKCRDASWIFSESEFDKSYLKEIAGADEEKLRVVRCGLDPVDWPEPDWASDRYSSGPALFVGTLGPKKGVMTLMEAIILLNQEGLEIRLEVVGDGPLLGGMQSALKSAGAEKCVHFHGELYFKKLVEIYRRARFLVLPSMVTPEGDRDGIPVTLLEGMASGLACITTPVSGIPEIVMDGVTGIMTQPGDARALADAIRKLWNNPAPCREIGRKGRKAVFQLHSLDRQASDFMDGITSQIGQLGQHGQSSVDTPKGML